MCKDRELMSALNSYTTRKNHFELTEGNISRPPNATSNEDSEEIMDVWSDFGGKVIRHDKGNGHCFTLWLVCIIKEFLEFLRLQFLSYILLPFTGNLEGTSNYVYTQNSFPSLTIPKIQETYINSHSRSIENYLVLPIWKKKIH